MEKPSGERLSGTEEEQPEFYEKDKGSAGIHGQIFEYKFCALIFLRAIKKGYKFKLASNAKGLGAFGDVVVEYLHATFRKAHIFVQLKSKARRLITMSQLKSKDGDFSLSKYYESYIQIEDRFNCSEGEDKIDGTTDESRFVIYTNTDVAQGLKSNKVTETDDEKFLMTGGSVLQFNEQEHKSIYEHLQDLPKHREFLSRFRICYSQADEKQMDCHIKRELQQRMNLPESELELAYMCFRDCMKDWWQDCNYFLKETNCKQNDPLRKTSEKVRTTLVAKILDQRKCELDDLSIKYKQSAITDLKQLIEPHKAVLIFAPGRSTTLTAAKIHQMLSATEHILLNVQQFVRYKSEVMFGWNRSFKVMVLEGDSCPEDFQDFANETATNLNECAAEKKFIFISDRLGNIQQISTLRCAFSTKLAEEYDDWKFTDIITESRNLFLEKKVTFQGTEIQIKNIVKKNDFRMLNALDCDSMSLLLGNEKPTIGTSIENTLEYYIDRTLRCSNDVNPDIQNESEIMVPLRNDTLDEPQGISAYREKSCTISDCEQGTTQLSLGNENKKESRTLRNEKHNLQGLCVKDEQHPCERNTYDHGNSHRHLERNPTTVRRPETLLDCEDRIILITDEPGMGKSTLLSHLAKETRKRHHEMWIVRININNYTNILHDMQANALGENGALTLLTQAAQIKDTAGVQLEKHLFNYVYNSTGNMAVLIDGVDEVSPHYTEEVIQILRILSKTKIRTIWVTSRNSVKDQLEQEFQCQSYSLTPFSLEDQKSFLVKFWEQKYSNTKRDYLENLANQVVELSLKYLSVGERDFMGVPLQSMLLAEVFCENVKQCSTSTTVQIPEHINLVMLYELYVKKKWDIYLSEKKFSDLTNVSVRTDDDALYDIFIDNHKAAALMAILSTHQLEKLNDKNILKKGAEFLQKIEEGLEKKGIITDVIDRRPVFQHRTCAEYFVARCLCDDIETNHRFIRDHIFEARFHVVRSIVDRILANESPLHEAVLNSNLRHVEKLLKRKQSPDQKDRGGRTPLHVAVSCRNTGLITLLLEHGADVRSVDTLLVLSPVEYAIRMDDWEILSLVMEKRPEIREQVLSGMNHGCTEHNVTIFRAAAKCGHTDLLRYLISLENCVNMPLPGDNSTLLHEAARGNHIETVRTLVDLGASCEIEDANGKTALHVSAEAGSLEVAKFIVDREETSYGEAHLEYTAAFDKEFTKLNRLNVHDNDGNTPLHLAAAAGNTKMLDYLLSAGSHLNCSNRHGENPFSLAARYGRNDCIKSLLQGYSDVRCEEIMTSALTAAIVAGHLDTTALLLSSGAPVSGGENEQPIHTASQMGNKEIVRLLLQYGANLKSRTDSGNTALHLASEAGHMGVVKYLVETEGDDLHSLNYESETPLLLAARNGREYLVKYFVQNSCNINAVSANGTTCLHDACENGHYTTVEYLLKHGAEVNTMNSANQTPLHIAACRGQTKILELLSLHKANFSLRDKDGNTALLAASRNGHTDTLQFIVQHGGNIEDTDGEGNTIAHFAVANGNCDILKSVSKHNINLDVQNSDGDTPLLQAVREGRNRIAQYLVGKLSDINAQDIDGMRPLDVAVLKGNLELTHLLLERHALSCKPGMDIFAAARFGFVEFLQRFVKRGDDMNVTNVDGESALHMACKYGQVDAVQYLCEHGALFESQDNSGNTALHVAISNGHFDVTRILVGKGASMAVANVSGSTALHIAAVYGHANIVHLLADSFSQIDLRNVKKQTALLVAAAQGHEEIVRILVEQGAGLGVKDIEGKTALDIATEKGYVVITQLLKDRAEGNRPMCSKNNSDLHNAVEGGNLEILHRTVNAGVSTDKEKEKKGSDTPNVFKTRSEGTLEFHYTSRSALRTASLNGTLEEVQGLVKAGLALDYCDTFGRTALWVAASRGHLSIIRFLLESGSCANIPDFEGVKPVDIAAREGHWDAVDEFIMHDLNIRLEGAENPNNELHRASESGNFEVLQILKCDFGDETTKQYGYTALHAAANSGHKEVARILIKNGASVNIADNRGKTPLILAAEKGHVQIVREVLNNKDIYDGFTALFSAAIAGHAEVVRELLNHGATVSAVNDNDLTPLGEAASRGHLEVVRELLNHCASMDIQNKKGETALYISALNGHVGVVRELLKHGAAVDFRKEDGSSPINAAASEGYVQIVRELLNQGAGVDIADEYAWTSLNAAAFKGHVEVVHELLNHGAGVNIANKGGATPLYSSALNGHVEVVRVLLNHGAGVDVAEDNGWTPLKAAASNGHVKVVEELLNHGAGVNISNEDGATPLYSSALNGHVEVVRVLLNHGAGVDVAKADGWTPLNTAAHRGHVEVVQELLDHGAGVNIANKGGATPLYSSALHGHVEVVRVLLNHGAGVDVAKNDGWTPLNAAAFKGHVEVVQELLNHGAGVNIVNKIGATSLYSSALNGHVEVVRVLLNYGAGVNVAKADGWTPLNTAANRGHVEVVQVLLNHGAGVNIANKAGATSLYSSALNGHVEVLQELLNHGAGVDVAQNDGWTPLNAAAFKGHVEVVQELLNHGAGVNIANKDGVTPLYSSALNGHVEVVRMLLNYGAGVDVAKADGWTPLNTAANRGNVDVVQELLNHSAAVNIANKDGVTPFYSSALNGHVEVVRMLLNYGAGVDVAKADGWTPLNTAANRGHVEVVHELLNHNAGVNIANKGGATSLYLSALNGHVEVVRVLLNHGAAVDVATASGWTALNAAAYSGHVEVVRVLLDHGAGVNIANNKGSTPLKTAVSKGHAEVVGELQKFGST